MSVTRFCEAVRAEGATMVFPGVNLALHLHPIFNEADIYGDGTASERIVRILEGGAQAPDALERPTSVGEQGACGLEIEVAR